MFNPQARTPFFDALKAYTEKDMVGFHTPGHKYGAGIDPDFLDFVGRKTFEIDLCELPEVDNLHDPEHVLKEAMELAAQAYGVQHSFFLVNGSTCGNNTMVMTVCDPGDKILIPRNVHKSVISGILLSGATPIYITPTWDRELGIDHNLTPEAVEAALQRYPDVKGLFVVNPTYYGVSADLRRIAEICHRHGKPLLVDEAHGPHLHFHEDYPLSAVDVGADMVVQSTHKIIAGMTQSSMLHINEGRINLNRARKVLQLMQSTSPNYLLMASLDTARRQMALHGKPLLQHALDISRWARTELNKIPGIHCFGTERVGFPGLFSLDESKLTLNVSGLGVSGFDFCDWLNERYGIQSEMGTLTNVLEIVTFANTQEEMVRLVESVRGISQEIHHKGIPRQALPLLQQMDLPDLPQAVLSPREAFYATVETIPFVKSAGRVCTEVVSPYPPGIPILVPGERITQELVDYLQLVYRHGGFINGPDDIRLNTIKVVA